jgi:hypothetical protein
MEILNLKKKNFPMFPVTFWWRDMMSHLNYYAHLAATRKSFGFAATHRVDCGYLSSSCFPAIERKRAHNVNMYPRRYITQRNNSSQHLAWWTKKKLAVQGLGWFSSQGPAGYLRCWGWLLFSESSTNRKKEEDEYVIICTRKLSWGEAAL